MNLFIDKTPEPIYEVFYTDGTKIGDIGSRLELLRLQVRIKNLNLPQHKCIAYIKFLGEKFYITNEGIINTYPIGFYDENIDLMFELL